jgi:tetratricopeptide (TPR) repeat protein
MHVYRNYSEALHYDSKTSQARDASLKALKIAERLQNKGMEATIWGELGYVCASEQRFPESLQWYRKFASKLGGGLEKLKGNEWMHAAHALASLERADELIQLYESRLVGNDTQGHVMHSNRRHLAYAYMQKGRYREAAQLVEQNKYASADVSTQDGRVFDLIPLTMAYAFDGRGQQAMAALKETEAHPHFADIVGFNEGVKALVAAKSGDRRAAKANLDKALELDYHYREPDTRKDRDTIFQGIRFLRLSKEAAAIIGDKQREQAVSERIQELKDELRSGGFF